MDYKKLLPPRKQNSHKGTFGKALNIAGSTNFQGAAYLSSISALKIGAGYVTLACPDEIVANVSSLTPDITFLPLSGLILDDIDFISDNLHKFDVVSLGCGLSCDTRVVFLVEKILDLLRWTDIPVIIDADGLNSISLLGIKKLPQNTIITPHQAEMARLMATSVEDVSSRRAFFAKEASLKFNCITVLKGNETIICDKNGEFVINHSGNSALAKAGSGDVLTGMITGLVAQGCSPIDAAILGVYLHGLCGELASAQMSEYCVLASDLTRFIPESVTKVLQTSTFLD